MQLLRGQWEQKLKQLLGSTEQSVLIISPFITKAASALLRPFLEHRKLACKVITRRNLNDFFSGVSDHNALGELISAGATVKAGKRLHAKVYIFDRKWAVLTSANFTAGGLTINHEWGLLVSHQECHEIFEEAEALWLRLANTIQLDDISSINKRLKEYRARHRPPEINAEDMLPDEGETIQPDLNAGNEIPLKLTASEGLVRPALELAVKHKKIASGNEYKLLFDDLITSGYLSISVRSFLWLVGWCNTGGKSYGKFSKEYIHPLALSMFGYVPERFLQVDGKRVNLGNYRYGSKVRETLRDGIIVNHRDRLSD